MRRAHHQIKPKTISPFFFIFLIFLQDIQQEDKDTSVIVFKYKLKLLAYYTHTLHITKQTTEEKRTPQLDDRPIRIHKGFLATHRYNTSVLYKL